MKSGLQKQTNKKGKIQDLKLQFNDTKKRYGFLVTNKKLFLAPPNH